MPEFVSFRLYLLLDALKNSDIARDRISNFRTHLKVKYSQKETHTDIIFYIHIYNTKVTLTNQIG